MKAHKILVVDDDRDHLFMVACMCRKAGYDVISAIDAHSALQLAVEQNPDLLLLDVHMNDADGYAVQERLQQIDAIARIPVIYLTGDQSNWVECMIHVLGAEAVFRKPLNMDDLLVAVKNVLAKRDAAAVLSASDRRYAAARPYQPMDTFLDECPSPRPYASRYFARSPSGRVN